jgi:hypothetical protein
MSVVHGDLMLFYAWLYCANLSSNSAGSAGKKSGACGDPPGASANPSSSGETSVNAANNVPNYDSYSGFDRSNNHF